MERDGMMKEGRKGREVTKWNGMGSRWQGMNEMKEETINENRKEWLNKEKKVECKKRTKRKKMKVKDKIWLKVMSVILYR